MGKEGNLFTKEGYLTAVGLHVHERACTLLGMLFQNGKSWEVAQVIHMAVEDLRTENVLVEESEKRKHGE